jgi:hypothetical protein
LFLDGHGTDGYHPNSRLDKTGTRPLRKRPAGALAGMAMILLLAAPAAMADRLPMPVRASLFDVPQPTLPVRDTVISSPSPHSARISSTTESNRYSINDGSGATIAVEVTAACEQICTHADPQAIANTVGTFIHGPEVTLLTVQLDTPFQLGFDCGFEAQACYFGGENKIVISGNDEPAPDSAGREFVLAHEYGHHVAQHRDLPAPFPPAIDWGTERWASAQRICQGHRDGNFFPGDEGASYYSDPGEAFAEAFAFNRFPDAAVRWAWAPALRPNAVSLGALRRDVLRPWVGRRTYTISGRVPRNGQIVKTIPTPFDGMVSVGPVGGRGYEVLIHNQAGKVLRSSREGVSFRNRLDYTVCGQAKLRIAVRPLGSPGRKFTLTVQRP